MHSNLLLREVEFFFFFFFWGVATIRSIDMADEMRDRVFIGREAKYDLKKIKEKEKKVDNKRKTNMVPCGILT